MQTVPVAQGVVYRYFPAGSDLVQGTTSDALILDVDLRAPQLRVRVVAEAEFQISARASGRECRSAVEVYRNLRGWATRRNRRGHLCQIPTFETRNVRIVSRFPPRRDSDEGLAEGNSKPQAF